LPVHAVLHVLERAAIALGALFLEAFLEGLGELLFIIFGSKPAREARHGSTLQAQVDALARRKVRSRID
jgi:hypothetical protein